MTVEGFRSRFPIPFAEWCEHAFTHGSLELLWTPGSPGFRNWLSGRLHGLPQPQVVQVCENFSKKCTISSRAGSVLASEAESGFC